MPRRRWCRNATASGYVASLQTQLPSEIHVGRRAECTLKWSIHAVSYFEIFYFFRFIFLHYHYHRMCLYFSNLILLVSLPFNFFLIGHSTPNRAVWKHLIFDVHHFLTFFSTHQKTFPSKFWNFFDHRFTDSGWLSWLRGVLSLL